MLGLPILLNFRIGWRDFLESHHLTLCLHDHILHADFFCVQAQGAFHGTPGLFKNDVWTGRQAADKAMDTVKYSACVCHVWGNDSCPHPYRIEP